MLLSNCRSTHLTTSYYTSGILLSGSPFFHFSGEVGWVVRQVDSVSNSHLKKRVALSCKEKVARLIVCLHVLHAECIAGIYVVVYSFTTDLQGLYKNYFNHLGTLLKQCKIHGKILKTRKKSKNKQPRRVRQKLAPSHEQMGPHSLHPLEWHLGFQVSIPEAISGFTLTVKHK